MESCYCGWIDDAKAQAASQNLTSGQADLIASQAVLSNLLMFPLALILAFALLYLWIGRGSNNPQTTA